ncbi:MAG: glycosyltransferase family 1 protein [Chloroflexi bacterium]|nr:glycosyltransferase family 1 protein [Chloroflexota bacterium]
MARAENTTVIILSNVGWDFTWQMHQKLAVGLSKLGYHVMFVNPVRRRMSVSGQLRRVVAQLRRQSGSSEQGRQPRPDGVHLVNRWTLPDFNRSLEYVNRQFFVPFLVRRLQRLVVPCRQVVVISYLPFPTAMTLARTLDPDLLVSACFANWSASPFVADRRLCESEWLSNADFVLVNAPSLCEHARRYNPRVYCISSMVDFDLFYRAGRGLAEPAPGSAARCCYYGSVGPLIDTELLAKVSRRYQLRVIGPRRVPLPDLAPGSEVLAQVSYPELPKHLQDVDVFVLPYRLGESTAGGTPAKIFECFAMGNPVVSTYLPSLSPYQNLVYLSRTHDEFLMNIDQALHEPPERREQRIQIARANSTERWVNVLSDWILTGLNQKGGCPG